LLLLPRLGHSYMNSRSGIHARHHRMRPVRPRRATRSRWCWRCRRARLGWFAFTLAVPALFRAAQATGTLA